MRYLKKYNESVKSRLDDILNIISTVYEKIMNELKDVLDDQIDLETSLWIDGDEECFIDNHFKHYWETEDDQDRRHFIEKLNSDNIKIVFYIDYENYSSDIKLDTAIEKLSYYLDKLKKLKNLEKNDLTTIDVSLYDGYIEIFFDFARYLNNIQKNMEDIND